MSISDANRDAVEQAGKTQPGSPFASDNWAHRSQKMKCGTCMWWARKASDGPTTSPIGRCRRHAPTMNGYPVVYDTDWCGDHKLDETKA